MQINGNSTTMNDGTGACLAVNSTDNTTSMVMLGCAADINAAGIGYHRGNSRLWMTAGGGSENAATSAFVLAGTGEVGIGTNDPTSFNANRNNLVISDSGASGITLNAGTSDGSFVSFTDGSGHLAGEILYYHASNYMVFKGSGSNTEHFRIASNGDLTATDTSICLLYTSDAADE